MICCKFVTMDNLIPALLLWIVMSLWPMSSFCPSVLKSLWKDCF